MRLLWVPLGLIIRKARAWANRAEARPWSFASTRLILLLDIIVTFTRQTAAHPPRPAT